MGHPMYKDPHDCGKSNEKPVRNICTAGYYYNPKTKKCEPNSPNSRDKNGQ